MPRGIFKHKPHTKEAKEKMRQATLGERNHNYGKKLSKETKKKLSEAHKGKKSWMKGKKLSKKTRLKMGKARMGRIVSEETRRRISETESGKRVSSKTREKMSEAHKGEKSHFWKGGIYKSPYPINWTETLRRSIRERDNYVCQLCSKIQGDRIHAVHHIDYNKDNCNPNNLITLCTSCHAKTGNKRDYWIKFFNFKETQV